MIYNQISIGLAYQSYYKAHRHSRLLCCKPERSARSHNLPILLSQKQNVKGQSGKLFFAHQDQKLRFHSDSRQFQSQTPESDIYHTAYRLELRCFVFKCSTSQLPPWCSKKARLPYTSIPCWDIAASGSAAIRFPAKAKRFSVCFI